MAAAAAGALEAAGPTWGPAFGVLAAMRAARVAAHAASGIAWQHDFSMQARLARSAEAALEAGIAGLLASGVADRRGRRRRRAAPGSGGRGRGSGRHAAEGPLSDPEPLLPGHGTDPEPSGAPEGQAPPWLQRQLSTLLDHATDAVPTDSAEASAICSVASDDPWGYEDRGRRQLLRPDSSWIEGPEQARRVPDAGGETAPLPPRVRFTEGREKLELGTKEENVDDSTRLEADCSRGSGDGSAPLAASPSTALLAPGPAPGSVTPAKPGREPQPLPRHCSESGSSPASDSVATTSLLDCSVISSPTHETTLAEAMSRHKQQRSAQMEILIKSTRSRKGFAALTERIHSTIESLAWSDADIPGYIMLGSDGCDLCDECYTEIPEGIGYYKQRIPSLHVACKKCFRKLKVMQNKG